LGKKKLPLLRKIYWKRRPEVPREKFVKVVKGFCNMVL